jgi:hypothetical protein
MAEQKETRKILCEDLSQAKKVLLVQTTMTPGFKVIEEIANAACLKFQQDTFKVNPEEPNADRVVIERQRKARNITEFCDLFMASIYGHTEAAKKQNTEENQEAEDTVGRTFGIHPAIKGESFDAITKTFGIHPAKPVKKQKS